SSGKADGVDSLRALGNAHVAEDRASLLRDAGHVDYSYALALEMGRHAEDAADRDDAGAADPGDDDVVGFFDDRRLRQRRKRVRTGDTGATLELGAVHGHEGRPEALHAGKVLVAIRLIDGALAAPFGLERLHRHAIRLDPAIAAAFADEFVDDHPLVGIGELPALPAPALLGGASLVVDQHGDAGDCRKLLLDRNQLVAVVDGQPARPVLALGVFPRLVGNNDDASRAFGGHLTGNLRHRETAFVGLASRHRDGVVEQDFVGD